MVTRLVLHSGSGQRVALHWALLAATYPFFADVATNTGRLLALQGDLTLAQLTRPMQRWGDRSTMTRAVQRVIRSIVQWGVLSDGDQRGVYVGGRQPIPVPAPVGELLIEAVLMRHDGESLPWSRRCVTRASSRSVSISGKICSFDGLRTSLSIAKGSISTYLPFVPPPGHSSRAAARVTL